MFVCDVWHIISVQQIVPISVEQSLINREEIKMRSAINSWLSYLLFFVFLTNENEPSKWIKTFCDILNILYYRPSCSFQVIMTTIPHTHIYLYSPSPLTLIFYYTFKICFAFLYSCFHLILIFYLYFKFLFCFSSSQIPFRKYI